MQYLTQKLQLYIPPKYPQAIKRKLNMKKQQKTTKQQNNKTTLGISSPPTPSF